MANQKPVAEVRIGSIKAAIWLDDSEGSARYNLTFQRLYKDGDDWKSTQSFSRDDMLLRSEVAELAHRRIVQLQREAQAE